MQVRGPARNASRSDAGVAWASRPCGGWLRGRIALQTGGTPVPPGSPCFIHNWIHRQDADATFFWANRVASSMAARRLEGEAEPCHAMSKAVP